MMPYNIPFTTQGVANDREIEKDVNIRGDICEPFGRLVDAFIANKRSKLGKRFGFIRYVGVKNPDVFVKSLSNLWIGSHHVFIDVARFQRPKIALSFVQPISVVSSVNKNQANHSMKPKPNEAKENPSFASVVNGGVALNVKEVDTMRSIFHVCRNEGFDNLKIHHVEGLWVWIQFPNANACSNFKSNSNVKTMFTSLQTVSKNFVVDERMIWIEISGLPLCAWGLAAYKKVASTVEYDQSYVASDEECKEEDPLMESDDGVPDDIEADIPTKFDLDEQGPTFVDTSNHPSNLEN
nr:RNA-directed DNA polymerase, eukaryota, reverse transcriptase zinc-binding domain protein [Tanacetum cinerariifolium]